MELDDPSSVVAFEAAPPTQIFDAAEPPTFGSHPAQLPLASNHPHDQVNRSLPAIYGHYLLPTEVGNSKRSLRPSSIPPSRATDHTNATPSDLLATISDSEEKERKYPHENDRLSRPRLNEGLLTNFIAAGFPISPRRAKFDRTCKIMDEVHWSVGRQTGIVYQRQIDSGGFADIFQVEILGCKPLKTRCIVKPLNRCS